MLNLILTFNALKMLSVELFSILYFIALSLHLFILRPHAVAIPDSYRD